MNWINIKDKLPPENENVILTDEDNVFCGYIQIDRNNNIEVGKQGCDGICYGWCEEYKITHWMPLPSPPISE